MHRDMSQSLKLSWFIWGLAVSFYFLDYLARVAPGVMHVFLQKDFEINQIGFGTLTASFYIPYVVMQIPVGLIVDRVSVRRTLTLMACITASGCVVFGLASGLMVASLGRMLIGFSAAFAFVCSLRLATSWFPPTMLGLMAGLTQALGMLGAASGEAPISFLVAYIGWRNSMFVMAILFVMLALLLFRFIQDSPNHHSEQYAANSMSIWQSLKIILSHSQTWMNALYAGFLFVPTAVIGEAIGPAFLQYGRGLTAHQAAFATGLIFIGWGISGPLSGYLSDRMGKRKPMIIFSAIAGIILMGLCVFMPQLTTGQLYCILFLYGLTNTGVSIAYAVSTELHDRKVIGTCIGFTNMASIFVGATFQPIVGYLLDAVAGERSYNVALLTLTDFRAGLWLLPFASCVALILGLFIKETNCEVVKR